MRSGTSRREWVAAAALIVAAAIAAAWMIGLPGRAPRHRSPGGEGALPSPADQTLARLVELLPAPGERSFPRWRELARLGPPAPDASGAIGFDGLRLILERDDRDVRWRVGLLLDAIGGTPRPVAASVECRAADARRPWEARRLRRAWPRQSEGGDARWRARWRDPRFAAELEGRARLKLGGHLPVDVPRGLADAYSLLLDPLRPLEFVRTCDETAQLSPGRAALERLLDAGRDDLVRNVLRGLDPEGRVYAAEALLGHLEPVRADEAALRALVALEAPVRVRGAGHVSAREALGR